MGLLRFIRRSPTEQHFDLMLWYVLVILLILWALGLGFHVAGSLIHVLLVVALVVLVLQLITGRGGLDAIKRL